MTTTSESHLPVASHPRGSLLTATVAPRSSKNQIEQASDGALRIRVTAPPVAGAANTAVLCLLAEAIGIPRSRLEIVSGQSSRKKRILVDGLPPEELERRLILQARADSRRVAS